MFERQHLHVGGVGQVHRRNDAAQTLQVVGVIGNHQGVVSRVHVDGVVRTDQRPQHGHQVVRTLVVEREDAGRNLVSSQCCWSDGHR